MRIPLLKNRSRSIVLVKLAGIGDIAMACRSLNEQLEGLQSPLRIDWIIDGNYIPLAKKLLKLPGDVTLNFHPVDSKLLFQGSRTQKAKESLGMLRVVASTQPAYVLLLHRDWRYQLLVRPAFTGGIIHLSRERIHEVDAYRIAINRVLSKLTLVTQKTDTPNVTPAFDTNIIGILIGGAQGTKLTYEEKRWPGLNEFIRLALQKSDKKIILFGAKEDRGLAEQILKKCADLDLSRLTDSTGRYSLEQLPDIFSGLGTFVSIDSGLAHIAAASMKASGQKIISLFGPTDPKVWGARATGLGTVKTHYITAPCSPCYLNDGKFKPCPLPGDRFQYCMKEISVQAVLESILNLN